MRTATAYSSLLALQAAASSTAINFLANIDNRNDNRSLQEESICTCSPTSFTISLAFDQTCANNDVLFNLGIASTDCTITDGNGSSGGGGGSSGDDNLTPLVDDGVLDDDAPGDNIGTTGGGLPSIDEILADIPWLLTKKQKEKLAKKEAKQEAKLNRKNNQAATSDGAIASAATAPEPIRFLQDTSMVPVVITSMQFLELDIDGNVINIDDSFNDITALDGDSFTYDSVSSNLSTDLVIEDQLDFVPDTGVLFLIGANADGVEVRGRFVWRYTLGCGFEDFTIEDGMEFGWINFVSQGGLLIFHVLLCYVDANCAY